MQEKCCIGVNVWLLVITFSLLSAGSPHSLEEAEAAGRETGKNNKYLRGFSSSHTRPTAAASKLKAPPRPSQRSEGCRWRWSAFSQPRSLQNQVARGQDLTLLFLLRCIYALAKTERGDCVRPVPFRMSHPPREGQTAVFLNSTSKARAGSIFFFFFLNPSRFKALILDVYLPD